LGRLTEKSAITFETIGRDFACNAFQLETGLRQPTAFRLCEGAGHNRMAAYGRYRDDPMSIAMKKLLLATGK
jgi:hypothetical protein